MVGENITQRLYYCPKQREKKIDSEVNQRKRQASDLSHGPLNSTKSEERQGPTLMSRKSPLNVLRHEGKTTALLHSAACTQPQCCFRSRKLIFFGTVSNTSQKTTPTANFSFHRHQNTSDSADLLTV